MIIKALAGNASKLLLAAKKVRKATGTEFLISLAADEFSRASNTYVGKLRLLFIISLSVFLKVSNGQVGNG